MSAGVTDYPRRATSGLLAIAALCGLTACSAIPQVELKAYREAVAQSKVSVQEVMLDHQQARDELERRMALRARPVTPATVEFSTTFVNPPAARVDHAIVLGKAIDAIESYNDLLVTLAEGKGVEQVQGSARLFASVLGDKATTLLAPGIGILINDVLGALELARSREEFKKAAKAGAPVVEKILDVLIENAADYYALRASLAAMDTGAIKGLMAARIGALESRVEQSRSGPELWPASVQRVNAALGQVGGLRARKDGIRLEGKCALSKAQPCAALLPADVLDSILALEEDASRYTRQVEKMNTYLSLMQNYVRLLSMTKQALAELNAAVDRPQSTASQFEALYATALLIRKDLLKIRSV